MSLKLRTQTVAVGDHSYRLRHLWDLGEHPTRIRPPSLDPATQEGAEFWTVPAGTDDGTETVSSALWPMFGVLWPSGRALAGVVAGMDLGDARVLEVGCGLALPSLVAHHLGARVTASDGHPLAPVFLEHNVRLNGLKPLPYVALDWTLEAALGERYDVILASDVLYEPQQAMVLTQFLVKHLNQRATVVLVDPGRKQDSKFARCMRAEGFEVNQGTCVLEGDALQRTGRVLRCQRSHGSASLK